MRKLLDQRARRDLGWIAAELRRTAAYAVDPVFLENLRQELIRQFREAQNYRKAG